MNYNDEREIAKKMISIMQKRIPLQERLNPSNVDQTKIDDSETSEAVRPSKEDYDAEIQKFKSQIDPKVDFTTFNLYPENESVVFGGIFKDYPGFEWQMSIPENDGLYITTNNLQVTDEIVTRIQKLKAYYDNFENDWSNKIIEYKKYGSQG